MQNQAYSLHWQSMGYTVPIAIKGYTGYTMSCITKYYGLHRTTQAKYGYRGLHAQTKYRLHGTKYMYICIGYTGKV